ncbi:MAG: AAA family ATPase [Aureispira sp.]
MKILSIDNFKAYPPSNTDNPPFQLDIEKNVLLYGENGAGKSSIYQAIKMFFFKEQLVAHLDDPTLSETEVEQRKRDFFDKYRHTNSDPSSTFEIKILDVTQALIQPDEYALFMLNGEQIHYKSTSNDWRLVDMIKEVRLPIDDAVAFCQQHKNAIETTVNDKLADFLEGDLSYSLDPSKDYCIGLSNNHKNIDKQEREIPKYFNEAKINLVLLLTYFAVIKQCADELPDDKNKVLVLDDFITSLDSANRVFIIQHLLTTFEEFKIIVLTHNINFFNLFKYVLGQEITNQIDDWSLCNLCIRGDEIFTYKRGSTETVSGIRAVYKNGNPADQITNLIRKRFEVLVHQFAKILLVDHVEEHSNLFDRMLNGSVVYFYVRGDQKKYVNDLVEELEIILSQHPDQASLKGRLTAKINEYKWNGYNDLKNVLKESKLYKKIAMNPLSHGTTSIRASDSSKFIEKSLVLLEKLEDQLIPLIDNTITGEA